MALHSYLRIPLLDTEDMPITGYFDRLSVRPGESLQAHVSVANGADYKARLVRVIGADPALGAPGEVHILATSEDPPKSFGVVHEEMLTEALTMTGESPERLIRADMVYVETPAGGRIFSTGSITFCGSLWNGRGFEGPVSRILENVVRGFVKTGA